MKFTRGTACGVENCTSSLYFQDEGLWYCKRSGHLHQGEPQLPRNEAESQRQKQAQSEEKLIDSRRLKKGLHTICFQWILQTQAYWLVHERHLPKELLPTIGALWAWRLKEVPEEDTKYGVGGVDDSALAEAEGNTSDLEAKKRIARAKKQAKKRPRLIETLCLCYLGAQWLRLDLSLGDIFRWVSQGELLFVGAARFIPADWWAQLAVFQLASRFVSLYHISLPRLNVPLLLFKYTSDLLLPMEIYGLSMRISSLLKRSFGYEVLENRNRFLWPELRLIAVLVVAAKLSQKLDSVHGKPTDGDVNVLPQLDWETWHAAVHHFEESTRAKVIVCPGAEDAITEDDAMRMDTQQLDWYMDWFEERCANERNLRFPPSLLNLFPVDRQTQGRQMEVLHSKDDDSLSDRLMTVMRSLHVKQRMSKSGKGVAISSKARKDPPEMRYTMYRQVDDLKGNARDFYQAAANYIGVRLKTLTGAVHETELCLLECTGRDNSGKDEDIEIPSL
ncbi:MAG: hypothetical protein M1825_004481 [Sarcosagium campestre]|nr:MAG: hypothetical protein M1825_004481 [Sarcosagium campestre]